MTIHCLNYFVHNEQEFRLRKALSVCAYDEQRNIFVVPARVYLVVVVVASSFNRCSTLIYHHLFVLCQYLLSKINWSQRRRRRRCVWCRWWSVFFIVDILYSNSSTVYTRISCSRPSKLLRVQNNNNKNNNKEIILRDWWK